MRDSKTPREAVTSDPQRELRILSRLTAAFLLDTISIMRGPGDPIDSLLGGAIIQANVAEITHRAELQEAYVETDALPTDETRRPISINALAASLGLPFETVRRRVNAMVADGRCVAREGGVIVPSSVLGAPKYQAGAFRAYERVRAFYYQLRDCGVVGDLPAPAVELTADNFPIRSVTRLVGAYVLRIVETMGIYGDLVDGMILIEIFRSNVEALPPDRPGMVRDDERRPVAVSALAARLGLPRETVRRRVGELLERGICERVRGGIIVPARTVTDGRLGAALAANGQNLHRLLSTLARLGVLKVWDSLEPPRAAAEAV